MRLLRLTAFVAMAALAFAACGSDSDNTASDITASSASDTTLAARATTTAAAARTSPCLTKDEITAISGRAPDKVTEDPLPSGWPNGDCEVEWTDVADLDVTFQQLSSVAAAEQRYDETVARYKADKYHEELPCRGIGDECYLQCGTGNDTFTGCNGLLYARSGDVTISTGYGDAFLKLKPTREETVQLYRDLVKAYVAKLNAA